MILVINAGSSSLKYTLFKRPDLQVLGKGLLERIGEPMGAYKYEYRDRGKTVQDKGEVALSDHKAALEFLVEKLGDTLITDKRDIAAIGHRVVHGGEHFSDTSLIDERVKAAIRELIPLAPLHNPPNLLGIEVSEAVFPDARQVAVFDTAFHQTIPPEAYRYAVPATWYRNYGIRKYGFHGTSHRYVTETCQQWLGKKEVNLIIAHLGNGASICAVKNGRSVDNSMGMGPLAGLVMGTRSGDIDPSIIFHLINERGMSPAEVEQALNKASGVLGLGGHADMRTLGQAAGEGSADAELALAVYAYRLRQYIGSYMAILGKVDAIVFTAGIGENSPQIRRKGLEGLDVAGVYLDPQKNTQRLQGPVAEISSPESAIRVLVVPTDEELQIAREVFAILQRS